ncbi:glycine cleavage system aminomethyltransferase GcvT [Tistrella mobilis]|jgi:aminomethyltransferase|uniref:glycine cleavage system aminomethyltransferase GcvT n=1 Tax=Tistrella mobilis TaxID=171437 RepID=UPI0035568053
MSGPDQPTQGGAPADLLKTPLYDLHQELGGRMVPFAGYLMPVQFPMGIKGEHLHTRAQAGLFDVSHMGQARITGPDAAAALERLVPGDITGLGLGRMRYTQLTTDDGGIRDDLMATRFDGHVFLVVNAACKADDFAHIAAHLPDGHSLDILDDHALLALQGPEAAAVLAALAPEAAEMAFMSMQPLDIAGIPCLVSRSGYTGEDGYEISVPADQAEALARRLLADARVAPIGLGARDSLRLEAGLCLYGHDIDLSTNPVEAGLGWSIAKRRRTADAGYPGAAVIAAAFAEGPARKRVGLVPEGKVIAREGTDVVDPATGETVGRVTSGGFGPSVDGPVAMAWVRADLAAPGTALALDVRGKSRPAAVAPMPFAPHRYRR